MWTYLFRWLARWPLLFLHALGWILGWVAFLCSATYRRRFLEHARIAGYSFNEVRAAVGHTGKMVAELPRLWLGSDVPVYWEGAAVVEAALAQGQGVIALTPHLGCFEIVARAAAPRFATRVAPITVLYRRARKAWLREWVDQARQREGLQAVPTNFSGVKQMLQTLKRAGVVGLLPDQVPPAGLGVWAPFFGRDAYTMTLPIKLAAQTQARFILIWGERLPWGRGYKIHCQAFDGTLSDNTQAAAAQINAAMQSLIAQCPQQYLWGYARYKAPNTPRNVNSS